MIRFRDVCFSDLPPPPPLPGPVFYSLCAFTCSLIFREGSWWFRERQKEQQRFAAEAQAPVRTPVESSIFIACTLPIHRLRSTRLADPGVSRSWDLQSPVPQPLQLSPWIMGSIGRVWSSAVDHGFYYCQVLSFASFKISALKSALLATR